MKVVIEHAHLKLWGRLFTLWGSYVVFCLIAGATLHPRLDEVLFVSTLPLWILVPYIAFCFFVALIKSWIVGFHNSRPIQPPLFGQGRLNRWRRT